MISYRFQYNWGIHWVVCPYGVFVVDVDMCPSFGCSDKVRTCSLSKTE